MAGQLALWRPDPDLPGVYARVLKIQHGKVLICWTETGTLESARGHLKHAFTWKRYREVPRQQVRGLAD